MLNITSHFGKNQSLFNCLLSMKDPRVKGRVIYPLINIITITLYALICGCDGWKSIELFAHSKRVWLEQFLDLSAGIPNHQTFARVFALIKPEEFEKCLMNWINEICEWVIGDVITFDGKVIRGSSDATQEKPASHIVNAYSAKHEVTLGCVKVPDKSNEIKGIPLLLKTLDIKGATITIDAMGTQKGIANLIREKQGNYVLSLKQNHSKFYRRVSGLFNKAEELDYESMVVRRQETHDYGHGRIEKREYTVLPVMYLYRYKQDWKDLQTFIQVISCRHLKTGELQKSVRYYISSVPLHQYKRICFAIREHWQVENGLHYKLDVGLREDACLIRRGYADQNLSVMRKIVLKLLNDETSVKGGVQLKRIKAALSTRYLKKVVGF